jgi:hypothetical protein
MVKLDSDFKGANLKFASFKSIYFAGLDQESRKVAQQTRSWLCKQIERCVLPLKLQTVKRHSSHPQQERNICSSNEPFMGLSALLLEVLQQRLTECRLADRGGQPHMTTRELDVTATTCRAGMARVEESQAIL